MDEPWCVTQSAKTNMNVEDVFFTIARDIKQRLAETDSKPEVIPRETLRHLNLNWFGKLFMVDILPFYTGSWRIITNIVIFICSKTRSLMWSFFPSMTSKNQPVAPAARSWITRYRGDGKVWEKSDQRIVCDFEAKWQKTFGKCIELAPPNSC